MHFLKKVFIITFIYDGEGLKDVNKLFCVLIGYLLGSLNPAHFLSKRKGVDLRHEGTGNLGTTNTMLVMGKASAAAVLLLDMGKAVLSAKIAKWLFPKLVIAGMLGAFGAILGHIFPCSCRLSPKELLRHLRQQGECYKVPAGSFRRLQ